MRVVIVGLGIQGMKRLAMAGEDVVATVDPVVADACYRSIEQVPLDSFDAALVCTPDAAKLELLHHMLSHGKHVLVEKPLLATNDVAELHALADLAHAHGVACYTAYNHRFEPHIIRLKDVLDSGAIGSVYLARFFYGNGTALDVKRSVWRDQGLGVLADLGSHLLDLTLFLFGQERGVDEFALWRFDRFENRGCDHALFGTATRRQPALELEATLLSWRNTFTVDIFGELGSAHIDGLCKWGPSAFAQRRRIFPSGKPPEERLTIESPDPTWEREYAHFKEMCRDGGTNIENDIWISGVLNSLDRAITGEPGA